MIAIDSESGPLNHPDWRDGVRIGPPDDDRITAFIPPFEREDRVYQGTAAKAPRWMRRATSTQRKGRTRWFRRAVRSPSYSVKCRLGGGPCRVRLKRDTLTWLL